MLTAFQMSTEEQGQPKQAYKMSRKQKRALGLCSDSSLIHEGIPDNDEEEEEGPNSGDDDEPPTANASQVAVNTVALTLPCSQSTMSVASQVLVSGSTFQVNNTEEKHTKFNKWFQTATSTNEEVLHMSLVF